MKGEDKDISLTSIKKKARRRVLAKKGFYIHLAAYAGVSIILFVISTAFRGDEEFWIRFAILPLSVAIIIHYLVVFGFPLSHVLSEDWEEEQMEREMGRLMMEQSDDLILPLPERREDITSPQPNLTMPRPTNDREFV